MTASFSQTQPARRGPTAANALVVGVVASIAVLALFVAGITFFGLAIAFPIAVPVAVAYHVPVSAADLAIAERFSGLWWAFLALAVASFGFMAIIVAKVINVVSPPTQD